MAVTRLSGGLTPANGSDPRTFPTIWNNTADDIEAAEANIGTLQGDVSSLQTTAGTLTNQSVRVYDDATARDAAITSPTEGMVVYLKDSDQLQKYVGTAWRSVTSTADMPAGSIIQLKSTTKTDTFSLASSTFTDVTGLSVSITPSSTSSKIMCFISIALGTGNADYKHFRLMRDSTAIGIGDSSGSRIRTTGGTYYGSSDAVSHGGAESASFLDSPNTTSAVTYKVQVRHPNNTVFVNRNSVDTDGGSTPRSISTITVMEVAG